MCDGVVYRTVEEPLDAIGGIDDRHVNGVADNHLGRPHHHHLTDLPRHDKVRKDGVSAWVSEHTVVGKWMNGPMEHVPQSRDG